MREKIRGVWWVGWIKVWTIPKIGEITKIEDLRYEYLRVNRWISEGFLENELKVWKWLARFQEHGWRNELSGNLDEGKFLGNQRFQECA